MVVRVNGGIINNQTLTGSLRFFKMTGPFAWTVSNGTVNVSSYTGGGEIPVPTYFVIGDQRPVPNSAAELAFREITKQADVTIISLVPGPYAATSEIHFACSATGFGWGSDTPAYGVAPANTDEDLTAAAGQMQAAVRALGNITVYTTVGSNDATKVPVTATANMATVNITEVPFKLV